MRLGSKRTKYPHGCSLSTVALAHLINFDIDSPRAYAKARGGGSLPDSFAAKLGLAEMKRAQGNQMTRRTYGELGSE